MTAPYFARGPRGTSIDSITASGDDLTVHLSDSTQKTVTVPSIAAANTARIAAEAAASDATQAALDAVSAQEAAETAASSAESVASTVGTAVDDAQAAASSAAASQSAAESARSAAEAAQTGAEDAATTATGAATQAQGWASDADDARQTADSAAADAATAQAGAESAQAAAEIAQAAAEAAAGSIGDAVDDAQAAQSAAAASASAAAGSASTAESAATTASTAASDAADAATAAQQSAEDAASVVLDGVPNASPTIKGGLMLAGDLAGTWDAPTVPGLAAKADLVGGVIPTSQIPAIAMVTPHQVADTAARLALTDVQPGDVAVQAGDPGAGTWMLKDADPSLAGSWVLLTSPTDAVSSVNGHTGVVVLGAGDVGLGQVDNTADVDKPISDAAAAALAGKSDTTHKHAAADITSGVLDATRIPTIEKAKLSSAVQSEIDGKVDQVGSSFSVYTTDENGDPDVLGYSSAATPDTIVYRSSDGIVRTGTPVAANDAATKSYVDGRIWFGTEASLPSTGTAGVLYVVTD